MSVDSLNLAKFSASRRPDATAFEVAVATLGFATGRLIMAFLPRSERAMLALRPFHPRRLIDALRIGVAMVLPLLVAAPARADIVKIADTARGIVMTQAQCAAIPQAVWVSAFGNNLCMRYYLSTAGGEGSRPVVFLQGNIGKRDLQTRTLVFPPDAKDGNTDDVAKYADNISKGQKTTAIYLARMGRDGSSGSHFYSLTELEVQATNLALQAIKERYGFEGFHVYGHSGGANMVGGLLTLRQDIGCAVLAEGVLAGPWWRDWPGPGLRYFDSSTHIPMIARNRSARIHVVTDPQDTVVPLRSQHPFVESLRKAGRQVEEYFVDSSGYDLEIHHHTTPHAEVVMRDCIRGASHDEIAADLAEFVAKRLADKARAGTNAIVRTQDAPAPRVGALLNGTRYFGADYSNFWVRSAEPTLCQNACRSDAKCVAWTYVQPGVQGEQARCWLKDQVPLQQSQSTCCTSGVERPEHGTPKRD